MQGVIRYIDKSGEEKSFFFHCMRFDETPQEFLERSQVEFAVIKECWTEDWDNAGWNIPALVIVRRWGKSNEYFEVLKSRTN